jgi:F-type H+-transporting ATPase subunit epsilon
MMMNLEILLAEKIFLQEKVGKIIINSGHGSMGILPGHIDFVATLEPGLFLFDNEQGDTVFLAVDEGILVKQAESVVVSTRRAIRENDLDELKETVDKEFNRLDETEKKARTALSLLEASMIKKFQETQINI